MSSSSSVTKHNNRNSSSMTTNAKSTNDDNADRYLNLKPLKALDQNWDIDIASCLQDYLRELHLSNTNTTAPSAAAASAIEVNLPPELKTNFTNAAILLQNSSSVYSRKVEYLYNLVYKALDDLMERDRENAGAKNGSGNPKGKRRRNADPDIEEFENFDPDWNFLVFEEDTLPVDKTGATINLPDSDNNHTNTNTINAASPANNTINNNNMNMTLLDAQNPNSITRLDQTLHTVTQNRTSIQSHAAQQLVRNYLRSGNGAGGTGAGGTGAGSHPGIGDPSQGVLRLWNGVCDVHCQSGALLLPGTTAGMDLGGGVGLDLGLGLASGDGNRQLDMTMEGDTHEGNHNFHAGVDDNDHDDYDNDGEGFVIHSPSIREDASAGRPSSIMTENVQTVFHGNANPDANTFATRNLFASGTVQTSASATTVQQKPAIMQSSPWDLLDPHDATDAKSRPLRVAVTYRLPEGIDDPPSFTVTGVRNKNISGGNRRRKRRGASEEQEAKVENAYGMQFSSCKAVEDYRDMMLSLNVDGCGNYNRNRNRSDDSDVSMNSERSTPSTPNQESLRKLVPIPIKKSSFGDEFLYIAKAQKKLKAAEKRRLKRLEAAERNEPKIAAVTNERFEDMHDDDDDDGYEGTGFDFAGGDDDDHYSLGGGEDGEHSNGYNDNLDDGEDAFGRIFDNHHDGDRMGNGAGEYRTFEELCTAHLKEFAKGAERFAVETHLSRRVSKWQSKLEVILMEEDERPEFNIQAYGNQILKTADRNLERRKSLGDMSLPNNTIDFASITKTEEPYEVCRTFLASLSLCNSENISLISRDCGEVAGPDDLHIQILRRDVDLPMETYLAPSLVRELEHHQLPQLEA